MNKKVKLANCKDSVILYWTASAVYWSEFLATDSEVPGSIPGAIRLPKK
jgi:hypothetical protein